MAPEASAIQSAEKMVVILTIYSLHAKPAQPTTPTEPQYYIAKVNV